MRKTFTLFFACVNLAVYAQSDSLVFMFGRNINVYKNTGSQLFKIKEGKKTLFKDVKFVELVAGRYLNVLDKKNSLFFVDDQGRRQDKVMISIGLCGTVPHYTYEIAETDKEYILTKDETFYDSHNSQPPVRIGSLNKSGIKRITFYNGEKRMDMTENDFIFLSTRVFPEALIVETETGKGLFYDNKLTFYDEVEYKDGIFKVTKDHLLGYFNIIVPKYVDLQDFKYGLARFKLPDGKTGFVDAKGKEYYDR